MKRKERKEKKRKERKEKKRKEKLRRGDNISSTDKETETELSDSELLTLSGGFEPATLKSLA
jgi:hypothetical protein